MYVCVHAYVRVGRSWVSNDDYRYLVAITGFQWHLWVAYWQLWVFIDNYVFLLAIMGLNWQLWFFKVNYGFSWTIKLFFLLILWVFNGNTMVPLYTATLTSGHPSHAATIV